MSQRIELDHYDVFLREVKDRIASARVRAALAVNAELVALYWQIGRMMLDRQESHGWGGKVINRLAVDLRTEFPGVRGFSNRNLQYMQTLAAAYPEPEFAQHRVSEQTLEDALVERIQRFLLELGSGFAFVGRQHRLVVGGDEFFVDMLFSHLRLRCYVVVEYALQDIAAPAVSEYAHVLPSPDELRTAIDEGRRAYLEAAGA